MTQVQATPCELSISLPSRRDVERDLWNEQVQKAAGVRSEVVLNLLLDRPATELTPETILALFKRHLREPRLILSFLLSLTQESPAARDQIRGLVAGEARTIVENLRLAVGYSKTIESLEALALLKVLNKDEWLNLGTPTLRSTIEDIYVGALLSREVLRRGPHGERGASERVDFALVKLNSMVRLVTGQPLASFLLDEGSPNLARRIAEARCGPLDQSNGQGSSAEVVAWCFDHLGAQDVVLSRERGGFTDQAFQARLALDLQNRLRELYDRYDSLTPWSKEGRLGVLRDLRYLKLLLPLLGGNQGITETHAVFLARILRNEALSTETRGLFVFSGLASLVPTIRSVLPPPTTRETQQAHLDLLIFEHLTNPSGVTDEHRLSARSFVTQVHEIARSYCRDPQLTYPWGQLKLRLALNALLKIHIPLTANDCFQCIEGVLLSSDQKGFVGTGRSTDILALGITLTLMYPDQRATIWSAIDGSKLLQFFPTDVGIAILRELGLQPFAAAPPPTESGSGYSEIQALILRKVSEGIAGITVSPAKLVRWEFAREVFGDKAVLRELLRLGLPSQMITALNIEGLEDPTPAAADGTVEFMRMNLGTTTEIHLQTDPLRGEEELQFIKGALEEIALRRNLSAQLSLGHRAKHRNEAVPVSLQPRYRVLARAALREIIEHVGTSSEELSSIERLLGQTLVLTEAQFETIVLRNYRAFVDEVARTENFETLKAPHSSTSNFLRLTKLLTQRGYSLSDRQADKLPDTPELEHVPDWFPDGNLEEWINPKAVQRQGGHGVRANVVSCVLPPPSVARRRLGDADPEVRASTIAGLAISAVDAFQDGARYLTLKEILLTHYKRAPQEDHLPLASAFVQMIEQGDIYLNGRLERDLERVLRDARHTGTLDWNHVAVRTSLHHGGAGLLEILLIIALNDQYSAKDRDTATTTLLHSEILERKLSLALTEQYLTTGAIDTLETRALLESCSWDSSSRRARFLAVLRTRGEVDTYRDPHGEDPYYRDELVPEGSPALELAMRRIPDPDDRTAAVGFFEQAALARKQPLGVGEVEMLAHALVTFTPAEQQEVYDAIRAGKIPTQEILFALATRELLGPPDSDRPLLEWRRKVQQFWKEFHQDGATPVDERSPIGPSPEDLLALLRTMSIQGDEFSAKTAIAIQTATASQIRRESSNDLSSPSGTTLWERDIAIVPARSAGLHEQTAQLAPRVNDLTPRLLQHLCTQSKNVEVSGLASRLLQSSDSAAELATLSERAAVLYHDQQMARLERAITIAQELLHSKTIRLGTQLREQLRQLISHSALPKTAGSVLNLYHSLRNHEHRTIDRQVLISTQDLQTALQRLQEQRDRLAQTMPHRIGCSRSGEELNFALRSNEAQRALCMIHRWCISAQTEPEGYRALADALFRVLSFTNDESLKTELLALGRSAARIARELTEQEYVVLCTSNPWILLQLGDYPIRTCLATGSMPIRAMALQSQVQDPHIKALCVVPRSALGLTLESEACVHPIAPLTTEQHRAVLTSMIGRRIVKLVENRSSLFLEPLYAKPSLRQLAQETINTALQPLSDSFGVEVTESGLEKLINVPASLSPHGQFEDRRREDGSAYPLCLVKGPYQVRVTTLRTPKLKSRAPQDEQSDR